MQNKNGKSYDLITITGPTASGKTAFASQLAAKLDAEIISADSRQVYRGMDLGTGKDYDDYRAGDVTIPYHLIDIADPGFEYNVFLYQKDFLESLQDIDSRGKNAILCGGTGLYIQAVLSGYKLIKVPANTGLRARLAGKSMEEMEGMLRSYKTLHNKTDTETRKRLVRAIEIAEHYARYQVDDGDYPEINSVIIALSLPREERRRRITARLGSRLENGMIEEVKGLLDKGIPALKLMYYGLEYKYITQYLLGEMDYEQMFSNLNTAIHQFAKRQMTWFRKMEKDGFRVYWIDGLAPMEEMKDQAMQIIEDHLKLKGKK